MKEKRVGILGGTFDPIHTGHLAIAQVALTELKLDKVLFVPSNKPPHKSSRYVISERNRYNMVKLAIRNNTNFVLSDFEVKRQGKSYSYITVRHFKKTYPKGTKFYFIIGGDSLAELHTWKNIEELTQNVTFVVINRPGTKIRSKIKVRKLTMLSLDISSSYIRDSIRKEKSVRYLLPDQVISYIKKNKLYK